jgi:hypothetical protein
MMKPVMVAIYGIIILGVIGIIASATTTYEIEERKQFTIQEKQCLDSNGTMDRAWGSWYCTKE